MIGKICKACFATMVLILLTPMLLILVPFYVGYATFESIQARFSR